MALPSLPKSIRSKKGLLIIDEAAFCEKLKELLKAAMAFLMWGGKVVLISTHDGVDNPFNVFLEDIRAGRRKGKVLKITFEDALADGLYERIMLVTRKKATPDGKVEWIKDIRDSYGEDADEELDVKPSKGSGSWISPALIAAAAHEEAGHPRFYQGGLCYVGRDIARRNHLATILPFEDVDGVLWQRESVEMRNKTFAYQDQEFDRIMTDYRVVRAGFDQTGMGEKVVEDAQIDHGDIVEGVLFSPTTKLNMATILKKLFENGMIRIKDDEKTKADFRSIKKVSGSSGHPRLVEDGTSDGHGDRFWAAALAALMHDTPYQQYAYKPVHPGSGPDRDPDQRFGSGLGLRGNKGAYG
jgi:phage FluMu gp28-like protein